MSLTALTVAVLLRALLCSAQDANLLSSEQSYLGAEPGSNNQAVFAPDVILGGAELASVQADHAGECAAACRSRPDCAAFNFCGASAGCQQNGTQLVVGQCQLLANDCTLAPHVAHEGDAEQDLLAGFPVRATPALALPGLIPQIAQGIEGGDFSCPNSTLPGKCAFRTVFGAAAACFNALPQLCRAIVVYANGTDGCSPYAAVIKTADLAPANTYMAPTVYTLERAEGAPTGGFIPYNETIVTKPDVGTVDGAAPALTPGALDPAASPGTANGTTAAAPASGAANVTAWLGCITAALPALIAGDVVATLSGVASGEACCRECRSRAPKCNVWNYCSQAGGCRWYDLGTKVSLDAQQCELRYQDQVDPTNTLPPFLLAKGDAAAGFTAGAPLAAWAPEAPGYARNLGGGLFGQAGSTCPGSLLPELDECAFAGTVPEMTARCNASSPSACAAIIYKASGLFGDTRAIGLLRSASGADLSRLVVNPTTISYARISLPAAGSSTAGGGGNDSGGEGLSAGAIAGIAVACAAALAVAAAVGGILLRRRQRRRRQLAVVPATPGSRGKKEAVVAGTGDATLPLHWSGGSGGAMAAQRLVYSGTLGVPSSGAHSPASPAGSRLPTPQLSLQQQRGQRQSSDYGGSSCSTLPLARISVQRQTTASPFEALRQTRMAAAGLAAPASLALQPPGQQQQTASPFAWRSGAASEASATRAPAQLEPSAQDDVHDLLAELLQFRAKEEALASPPGLSLSGLGTGSSAPTMPSGSDGSGAPVPCLDPAELPASLQGWLIPMSAITYKLRPNGEPVVLGEGASGRVVQAEYRGEPVAAKELQIGRGLQAQESFVVEAQRLQALRHPFIVSFYGVALDGPRGVLLMELCEGRDLGSALQLRDRSGQRLFGWRRHGLRVAYEVAVALNCLHAQSVVHMDVKSQNVLMSGCGAAKLSDVGVSRTLSRTYLSLPHVVGTFAWVAPEVLLGGTRCTSAVDIFSLSVLLWEIITGERPVRGHMRQPIVPEECPQEAVDLMAECGSLDPSARPTAQQIMKRLAAMLAARRGSKQLGSRPS